MSEALEPITAEWLRTIAGLPACKMHDGGYSEREVTLFLNDWESRHVKDRFWVLTIRDDGDKGWRVSASVQEDSRHNGTLYMAHVKTRGDAMRMLSVVVEKELTP